MSDLIEALHKKAEAIGVRPGLMFENVVRATYEAWISPGDIVVDVGAHKGFHLFPLVRAVGARGKVYGFEPIPLYFKQLKQRLRAESIKNVVLRPYALSDRNGTSEFNFFENRPAFSGLQRRVTPFDDSEGGLKKITVKRKTLDSQLPFFKTISAIKLDIEGGELHALMGAERTLKKSRPLVIFENGRQASANVYGYGPEEFFGFFDRLGMKVFWLSGEPFVPEEWRLQRKCWEFVALPQESAAFAEQLPALCRQVLAAAD